MFLMPLHKVALNVASFLEAIKSTRLDEFNSRCDKKFELSTVFKSSAEQDILRKDACDNSIDAGEKEEIAA
jgi:peptide alpha-N-acetyltransferase